MAQLDARGAKVAVIDKPYEGCEYVATGYGRSFFEENAMNNLRNAAGEAGATHVVVTAETQLGGPIVPGRRQFADRARYRLQVPAKTGAGRGQAKVTARHCRQGRRLLT